LSNVFWRFGLLKVKIVGRWGSFLMVCFHLDRAKNQKPLTAEIAEKSVESAEKSNSGHIPILIIFTSRFA
jgi:hypothetical protein